MKSVYIGKLQQYPLGMPNSGSDGKPRTVRYGTTERYVISYQSIKAAIRQHLWTRLPEHESARRGRPYDYIVKNLRKRLPSETSATISIATQVACIAALSGARNAAMMPSTGYDQMISIIANPDNLEILNAVGVHSNIKEWRARDEPEYDEDGEIKETKDPAKKKISVPEDMRDQYNDVAKSLCGALDAAGNVDVALCGRMVTTAENLSVRAAMSVGAAFDVTAYSMPTVNMFSMMDELAEPRKTIHLGERNIVQGNMYGEMSVDMSVLSANLPGMQPVELAKRTRWAIESFIESAPTAGSTTAGAPGLPTTIVAYVHDPSLSQPPLGSWWQAFDNPIRDQDKAVGQAATERLTKHIATMKDMYGAAGTTHIVSMYPEAITVDGFIVHRTVTDLVNAVEDELS